MGAACKKDICCTLLSCPQPICQKGVTASEGATCNGIRDAINPRLATTAEITPAFHHEVAHVWQTSSEALSRAVASRMRDRSMLLRLLEEIRPHFREHFIPLREAGNGRKISLIQAVRRTIRDIYRYETRTLENGRIVVRPLVSPGRLIAEVSFVSGAFSVAEYYLYENVGKPIIGWIWGKLDDE
jgi:hypothetical protein